MVHLWWRLWSMAAHAYYTVNIVNVYPTCSSCAIYNECMIEHFTRPASALNSLAFHANVDERVYIFINKQTYTAGTSYTSRRELPFLGEPRGCCWYKTLAHYTFARLQYTRMVRIEIKVMRPVREPGIDWRATAESGPLFPLCAVGVLVEKGRDLGWLESVTFTLL